MRGKWKTRKVLRPQCRAEEREAGGLWRKSLKIQYNIKKASARLKDSA